LGFGSRKTHGRDLAAASCPRWLARATDALDVKIHDQAEGLVGTDRDPAMEGFEAGVDEKDVVPASIELDPAQRCVPDGMPVDADRRPRAHDDE
jgi:hypothetical protein